MYVGRDVTRLLLVTDADHTDIPAGLVSRVRS